MRFILLAIILAGCSAAVLRPQYEKQVDLLDREKMRGVAERISQAQFTISPDEAARDILCKQIHNDLAYDLGNHPERGQLCMDPLAVAIDAGTVYCRILFGAGYHATRVTVQGKLYCARTGTNV